MIARRDEEVKRRMELVDDEAEDKEAGEDDEEEEGEAEGDPEGEEEAREERGESARDGASTLGDAHGEALSLGVGGVGQNVAQHWKTRHERVPYPCQIHSQHPPHHHRRHRAHPFSHIHSISSIPFHSSDFFF